MYQDKNACLYNKNSFIYKQLMLNGAIVCYDYADGVIGI